jgi:hypothetical protein
MHLEEGTEVLQVLPVPNVSYSYEFKWTLGKTGVGIAEVFFAGEMIPQSPVRVQVEERDCSLDFPGKSCLAVATKETQDNLKSFISAFSLAIFAGSGRVADENGVCMCSSQSIGKFSGSHDLQ